MFKILKDMKNYEMICKKRDHHEPNQEDVEDFIKNRKFPKETFCTDCGIALELKLDADDDEAFWIREN